MTGLEMIAREFAHQRESKQIDLPIDEAQLAIAAACYATPVQLFMLDGEDSDCVLKDAWPWSRHDDLRQRMGERRLYSGSMPADPETCTAEERMEMLAQAGAMIAREIDRLAEERRNAGVQPSGVRENACCDS